MPGRRSAGPPVRDDSVTPPAGRNAESNWHGQKRSNETHVSTTDPDARLARKSNGQASIMAYAGHVSKLGKPRNSGVDARTMRHAGG